MVLCASMALISGGAYGEKPQIKSNTKSFSVKLGATRVIYQPGSSGSTLTVINPQDYPILVQSKVHGEDKISDAPFIVTPPVFRLDGEQQSRIRIVQTGGDFPTDRESLNWLCVTGVPPKPDDTWNEGKVPAPTEATLEVQLRINSCVKLLIRPTAVKGEPTDVATSVVWSREGNSLVATNPTPFFMNLKSLSVGGKLVNELDYIPPKDSRHFTLPTGASGSVAWTLVTDYGGDSRSYQATIK
ncbi:TPA: fimbria/pilus periplasmic chaperone [Providencia alcalifaciens]